MAVHQQSVYAAVKTVLDAIPELGSAIPATPAANPSNNTVSTGKDNPWSQEGFNLTEQGRILRSDPKLAAKLKAAAGIKT